MQHLFLFVGFAFLSAESLQVMNRALSFKGWLQNRQILQLNEQSDGAMSESDPENWSLPDEVQWRVDRARLTKQWMDQIKRRKPRYMSYKDTSKWVRAMGQWHTEKEWIDWIQRGEKRNPYIPSDPEKYFSDLGEWKGWDDFLGVNGSKKEV